MSTPKLWFCYDHATGFEEYETEAEARAAAEDAIHEYRMDAGDCGWSDEVWSVKVGRITAWTVETDRRPPTEDEGTDWDIVCDYGLSDGKEGA